MVTTVKQKKAARLSRTAVAATTEVPNLDRHSLENIPIEMIDVSPFNYRKFYDNDALNSFAEELKLHGIISAVTLRKMPTGRYELVAGERRYRAAHIAELKELPAIIRILTDDEVVELQLAENIQRENPHPLHESQAIAQMQQHGHNIEEIAARLGKSKAFVYSRIKLSALIDPLQEVFLAGKLTLQEAFDIASIATQSQEEFYEDYCKEWKKKNFHLYNLGNILNRFRYDLKYAPFDTKDKTLMPDMGACTKCPFNSAVLKTLFPEMAKEAQCTNKGCYQQKCTAHLQRIIDQTIEENHPVALICHGSLSETLQGIIDANPVTKDLPVHQRYHITVFNPPCMPDKEDFADNFAKEDEEQEFDEDGFNQAMQEYEADLEAFGILKENGKASIGLFISQSEARIMLFSTELQEQEKSGSQVSAKQVQEAIKTGTVTAELLQGEINRLQSREQRSKEIDRDKVQLNLHQQFIEKYSAMENNGALTTADCTAARLIIFDSLDYYTRRTVNETLFPELPLNADLKDTYTAIANLTEQQYCYLIRMALAGKSDAKFPQNISAYTLYQVAENAGMDVLVIEKEQEAKMQAREARLEVRLAEMQKRLERLNVSA